MSSIVAIVGRPNVGKSTLFNRLTESRKAVISEKSGVTRDRHYGKVEWNGKIFTIIDTGGYVKETTNPFEEAIKEQIHLAMEESIAILFVVDIYQGLTDLDKEFAHILRPFKKKNKSIYIAANKADNTERQQMFGEFYRLGLKAEIYPVSAINGYGTGDLLDAVISHIKTASEEDKQNLPHIAIVGRPNVGKSSLINVLLNENRNIVTDMAGTTRDSIDSVYNAFKKKCILTDTAGIRKRTRIKENIEFYSVLRAIGSIEKSDVTIVLIDATEGIRSQDMHIIHLALHYRKGIMIMINKWDLVSKNTHTARQMKEEIYHRLSPNTFIPLIFTSVIKKQRMLQSIQTALSIYERMHTKILTSDLNALLLKEISNHPPPTLKQRHIKIKYITQLPTHLPVFAFFCNHPKYIKQPYVQFLENKIREHFSFEGVPIKIVFRKK